MRYGIIEAAKGGAVLKEISPLERAIEYIETSLNENIGLSDVSRDTGYSYYHMTRLFSSLLGESVGRYINRRRHSARRIRLPLTAALWITERRG